MFHCPHEPTCFVSHNGGKSYTINASIILIITVKILLSFESTLIKTTLKLQSDPVGAPLLKSFSMSSSAMSCNYSRSIEFYVLLPTFWSTYHSIQKDRKITFINNCVLTFNFRQHQNMQFLEVIPRHSGIYMMTNMVINVIPKP